MGKMQTCQICGDHIDKTACNIDRGVYSYYSETDETGMKIARYDLCGSCALSIMIEIQTRELKHNERCE